MFEATVDVRPEIELPDYSSVKAEAPSTEVTDEDIDEQLERLQDRFSELETISRTTARRPRRDRPQGLQERRAPSKGREPRPDYLYELGSGFGPPSLDDQLQGEKAGAILKFTDSVPSGDEGAPGRPSTSRFWSKRSNRRSCRPLDDGFAKTVGEFDSLDDLKNDLKARLADVKYDSVMEEVRSRALNAFIDAASLERP